MEACSGEREAHPTGKKLLSSIRGTAIFIAIAEVWFGSLSALLSISLILLGNDVMRLSKEPNKLNK